MNRDSLPLKIVQKISADGSRAFVGDSIRCIKQKYKNTKRKMYHNYIFDTVKKPYEKIYVDADNIEYVLSKSRQTDWHLSENVPQEIFELYDFDIAGFQRKKNIGRILGGEWDKHKRPIEELSTYESFRAHFVDGVPLEETDHVQLYLERIDRGWETQGYTSKEAFLNEYIPYIKQLYNDIKINGYVTQNSAPADGRPTDFFHEITVNIGRNGEMIFNNRTGYHRVAIAKILGLDDIPVVVIVRHRDWVNMNND